MHSKITPLILSDSEGVGEPAAPGARTGMKPNPVLLRLCRWLFRLALVLCAMPMLAGGIHGLLTGVPTAWILLVNGLFLLCAEWIFKWFNFLEKKR